jgi:hypothetical protein
MTEMRLNVNVQGTRTGLRYVVRVDGPRDLHGRCDRYFTEDCGR